MSNWVKEKAIFQSTVNKKFILFFSGFVYLVITSRQSPHT